jgi:hypothetical protein
LRGIIFPAMVYFFRKSEVEKNDYLTISWIFYIVAVIEASLFAEKESFFAFNFGNGYNFSLIPLYTFSAIELLKWMKDLAFPFNIFGLKYSGLSGKEKRLFISTIFFYWCIISGFVYLGRQILGYGYS